MPVPTTGGLPRDCDLDVNYTVRVTAVDPNDGSDVTGVIVSDVSIFAQYQGTTSQEDLTVGPFMLVPGPAT